MRLLTVPYREKNCLIWLSVTPCGNPPTNTLQLSVFCLIFRCWAASFGLHSFTSTFQSLLFSLENSFQGVFFMSRFIYYFAVDLVRPGVDCFLGRAVLLVGDEAKAARITCLRIFHDYRVNDLAVLGELTVQHVFRCVPC